MSKTVMNNWQNDYQKGPKMRKGCPRVTENKKEKASLRAQSCGLFLAKNSCEKRILRPHLGANLKIALR